MTQLPLLAVVLRWCKEGNNALSQLIHSFGVVRSNSKTISLERLFVSTHSAYLFLPEATSTPVSLARSIDDLMKPDARTSATNFSIASSFARYDFGDFRLNLTRRSFFPSRRQLL